MFINRHLIYEDRMTKNQLEALAKLMRANKNSVSYRSAELVLVKGLTQTDTVKILKSTKSAVQNGVTRYRKANNMIKKVY